ncbi:MAG: hypothetical protein IPJ69_09715 [Deltaproteobacteria bacterium]|nr:MAG: hypothetical protein IPJ69_09715 [Deltaproteobacteria bacterium]
MKNKILKIILCISFLATVCPVQAGVDSWSDIGPAGSWVKTLVFDEEVPHKLYAGTANGVFYTTDNGVTWTATPTQPENTDVMSLVKVPSVAGKFYAGTNQGVFITTDGGTTWTATPSQPADLHVSALAIDPETTTTLYAGTAEGLFVSVNSGETWALTTSQPVDHLTIRALYFDPATPHKLYVGTYVGIFYSTDSGDTWTALASQPTRSDPPNPRITAMTFDPRTPAKFYVGTYYEGIFMSMDAGASWTPLSTQPVDLHISALLIDTHDVIPMLYAGIYRSSIFTFQNSGCGNHQVETSSHETCDDGNIISGDGCSATCETEATPSKTNSASVAGCSLIPL